MGSISESQILDEIWESIKPDKETRRPDGGKTVSEYAARHNLSMRTAYRDLLRKEKNKVVRKVPAIIGGCNSAYFVPIIKTKKK